VVALEAAAMVEESVVRAGKGEGGWVIVVAMEAVVAPEASKMVSPEDSVEGAATAAAETATVEMVAVAQAEAAEAVAAKEVVEVVVVALVVAGKEKAGLVKGRAATAWATWETEAAGTEVVEAAVAEELVEACAEAGARVVAVMAVVVVVAMAHRTHTHHSRMMA